MSISASSVSVRGLYVTQYSVGNRTFYMCSSFFKKNGFVWTDIKKIDKEEVERLIRIITGYGKSRLAYFYVKDGRGEFKFGQFKVKISSVKCMKILSVFSNIILNRKK